MKVNNTMTKISRLQDGKRKAKYLAKVFEELIAEEAKQNEKSN